LNILTAYLTSVRPEYYGIENAIQPENGLGKF